MSNKLKEITNVIYNSDVRDPRATLAAIEGIIGRKEEKPRKPTIRLELISTKTGSAVRIKYDRNNITPKDVEAARQSLMEFGLDVFGECDDPNCPVHDNVTTDLGALFAKFEAELQKGPKQ